SDTRGIVAGTFANSSARAFGVTIQSVEPRWNNIKPASPTRIKSQRPGASIANGCLFLSSLTTGVVGVVGLARNSSVARANNSYGALGRPSLTPSYQTNFTAGCSTAAFGPTDPPRVPPPTVSRDAK